MRIYSNIKDFYQLIFRSRSSTIIQVSAVSCLQGGRTPGPALCIFCCTSLPLSLWPSSLSAGRGCGSCSQLSAAARRLLAKTCLAIQGRPSTARPAPQSAATELRLTEAKGTSKSLVLYINKIYQLKNIIYSLHKLV